MKFKTVLCMIIMAGLSCTGIAEENIQNQVSIEYGRMFYIKDKLPSYRYHENRKVEGGGNFMVGYHYNGLPVSISLTGAYHWVNETAIIKGTEYHPSRDGIEICLGLGYYFPNIWELKPYCSLNAGLELTGGGGGYMGFRLPDGAFCFMPKAGFLLPLSESSSLDLAFTFFNGSENMWSGLGLGIRF